MSFVPELGTRQWGDMAGMVGITSSHEGSVFLRENLQFGVVYPRDAKGHEQ